MDTERFDRLTRLFSRALSRRALAGVLGLAAVAPPSLVDARKKRRKRRPKRCRGCRVCTSCVRGRCRAVPNHSPCGGVCQECRAGRCRRKPDDTACQGSGRCRAGVCNPQPNCIGSGVSGCAFLGADVCCSGICEGTPPFDTCQQGVAGTPCRANGDCVSGACLGYRCQ